MSDYVGGSKTDIIASGYIRESLRLISPTAILTVSEFISVVLPYININIGTLTWTICKDELSGILQGDDADSALWTIGRITFQLMGTLRPGISSDDEDVIQISLNAVKAPKNIHNAVISAEMKVPETTSGDMCLFTLTPTPTPSSCACTWSSGIFVHDIKTKNIKQLSITVRLKMIEIISRSDWVWEKGSLVDWNVLFTYGLPMDVSKVKVSNTNTKDKDAARFRQIVLGIFHWLTCEERSKCRKVCKIWNSILFQYQQHDGHDHDHVSAPPPSSPLSLEWTMDEVLTREMQNAPMGKSFISPIFCECFCLRIYPNVIGAVRIELQWMGTPKALSGCTVDWRIYCKDATLSFQGEHALCYSSATIDCKTSTLSLDEFRLYSTFTVSADITVRSAYAQQVGVDVDVAVAVEEEEEEEQSPEIVVGAHDEEEKEEEGEEEVVPLDAVDVKGPNPNSNSKFSGNSGISGNVQDVPGVEEKVDVQALESRVTVLVQCVNTLDNTIKMLQQQHVNDVKALYQQIQNSKLVQQQMTKQMQFMQIQMNQNQQRYQQNIQQLYLQIGALNQQQQQRQQQSNGNVIAQQNENENEQKHHMLSRLETKVTALKQSRHELFT